MFYPQSSFHSQGIGYPQGLGYPQSFANSQSLGYPQNFGFPKNFGYPQGGFGQPGFPGTSNIIPFSNTLYGYPQLTPSFVPGLPPMSNWQQLQGTHGFAGSANGATQPSGVWQQPLAGPEQINPAQLLQSQQQLLLRLAQYHHFVAQQLAQLAAQQPTQVPGNSYSAQFIPSQFVPNGGQYMPSQLGANFVPGITMH